MIKLHDVIAFCIRNQVYLLGALGWLIVFLAYPLGWKLPTYADF